MSAAPFASVLVANRGEIACRIFRTARAMGMRTIAVYSDADAKAKHMREADVAVHIGPSPAAESYLRGEKILAAAKQTGAAAIHPGYGFLSENPEFAEAVTAAGLIWIGPTPSAIRAMGLKDEAKRIAIAAGVPVLAGYQGEDQSEKRLLNEAKAIGFPVLIKAVAGGGGRGIREVTAAKDFKDQLLSARREAKAAFGDDRVLVEKLVQRPRHIEVQVFGDKHGNLVHLYERDCSLQRRRQKVIEEAPAPGMTDEVRAAMTDAALKVARAVDYENAGTVEFIVDGEGPLRPDGFWFLEMNTRLQVEHPVTEAITGLDLVEWQFRVAAGEKLSKTQGEIELNGHAIEARICAEDPSENFRPSVGRLVTFDWNGQPRVDSGFDEGDTVPPDYDSMIAKLVRHLTEFGERSAREETIATISHDLANLRVQGVQTNASFLAKLVRLPAFETGCLHTGLIGENLEALASLDTERRLAGALCAALDASPPTTSDPWAQHDGWRLNSEPRSEWAFEVDGVPRRVVLRHGGRGTPVFETEGVRNAIDVRPQAPRARGRAAVIDGVRREFNVAPLGNGRVVYVGGAAVRVAPAGSLLDTAGLDAGDEIHAPLPGKIVSLSARKGAQVSKGEPLVTLEAMKMEHALKAPRDGIVAEVAVREGEQVKEGALLVRLEAEEAA